MRHESNLGQEGYGSAVSDGVIVERLYRVYGNLRSTHVGMPCRSPSTNAFLLHFKRVDVCIRLHRLLMCYCRATRASLNVDQFNYVSVHAGATWS